MSQTIKLTDSKHNIVAIATVDECGNHFSGKVDVDRMPEPMLRIFEEYEVLVNGQVLSLLDKIEERIEMMRLMAVFGDGREVCAADLQIFPKAGTISFKVIPQRVASQKV